MEAPAPYIRLSMRTPAARSLCTYSGAVRGRARLLQQQYSRGSDVARSRPDSHHHQPHSAPPAPRNCTEFRRIVCQTSGGLMSAAGTKNAEAGICTVLPQGGGVAATDKLKENDA